MKTYYDVVCSIYEENDKQDYRVDSHLICGGFKTEEEVTTYVETHMCDEYDNLAKEGQYSCIEIETHDDKGNVLDVVTVD